METKTRINAGEGKQDLTITRDFELPVDLLFRAYTDAELVEQWMGTRVIRLENKNLGAYQFETIDPMGNKHHFAGVIHRFEQGRRIIRTFEMENTPLSVWLEFLEFEQLTPETSRINMHVVYRSGEERDRHLSMPFAQGINMAHNRIQEILKGKGTDH